MTRSPKTLRQPLDPFEVTRAIAQDYGVEKLAPLMGRAVGTLHNKLNTNESSHHQLTLGDFIQINLITGNYTPLETLCHALGHACFAVPDQRAVSDAALLEHINRIGAEGGDFYRVLNIALEDRKFSRRDFQQVKSEGLEFIGAIAEALHRIEGLIDE